MRENNITCPHKALEQMSTRQLDELLQAELRKETPDEEVVLPILQVLRERESDHPVDISSDAEAAWDAYRARVGSSVAVNSARKWKWIGRFAAAAAIVCLLVMAVPNTVGAESIFDVLFRWTESVFEFLIPGESSDPPVEYVFETDNPGLQQLYDKVVEMGITEPVVPMWLPEGYELTELKTSTTHEGNKVSAAFVAGNSKILFTYSLNPGRMSAAYEKEDSAVEVYERARVEHFVMENSEMLSVLWKTNVMECFFSANISRDNVYKIIDSIYERE